MEVGFMRLFAVLLVPCSLLITALVWAADNPPADDEVVPDAMSRLIKAPEIDFETIRDPFLSSFEKARIEEAQRFKNRKELPSNSRKREPLEAFDLSALKLVATYKRQNQGWVASIQDNSGQSYTVRRGNYIGKRGGKIEKIDNKTVYLVEQTINPAGEIIDQQVTLTLDEVNANFN